jgi:hypothetical protein
VRGLGIGRGVTESPVEEQFSQVAVLKSHATGKNKEGYASVATVDEGVYNGEEYMQHPVRIRTVKDV